MKTLASVWLIGTLAVAVAGQARPAPANADLLRGAIDIHLHSFPDKNPRSLDAIDAAMFARARGMRAIVLKNHYEPTAGLAFVVRKAVPGIEVFGGIDLNLTVGGINPVAVEYMAQESGGWGRFVWMPTFDAENQVRYSKENRPFVSVSKNGGLLPQVREVIAVIAKHDLVLATGHSSADEGVMLIREGKRQGVRRMVVTHAMNPPIVMDVAKMKEAAQLGAFIEFVGGSLEEPDAAPRMDRFAAAIRAIGPEHCVLSSDLGQKGNPLPADGFAAFLIAMRAKGFTPQEIDVMSKGNPAQLVRLDTSH
ncbi:MAG TPA: DUF6282 family protein [Vicinamibacterales bacterium]|jgi:hypothetical protein